MSRLEGWKDVVGGQLCVDVISEKEQLQVISRSREKLWEWKAGMEWGWSLEHEEVKELNGQWLDGPQRKTLRQMLKSLIPEKK